MGFIYLLECADNDHTEYKIGFTKKSKSRTSQLQTGNSDKIKELCRFETKYNRKLEIAIHNQYNYCRKNGEWFDLPIKEVANFIKNCERIENNFSLLKDNPFFK